MWDVNYAFNNLDSINNAPLNCFHSLRLSLRFEDICNKYIDLILKKPLVDLNTSNLLDVIDNLLGLSDDLSLGDTLLNTLFKETDFILDGLNESG